MFSFFLLIIFGHLTNRRPHSKKNKGEKNKKMWVLKEDKN
jgi:hypothetical protein